MLQRQRNRCEQLAIFEHRIADPSQAGRRECYNLLLMEALERLEQLARLVASYQHISLLHRLAKDRHNLPYELLTDEQALKLENDMIDAVGEVFKNLDTKFLINRG